MYTGCCRDVFGPRICQISGSCSEATLCCIFSPEGFSLLQQSHNFSILSRTPEQAELIMFVLARFPARWTTAIVLNTLLPLIEHSHFLALTQEIKFRSERPASDLPQENQKKEGLGEEK